MADFRISLPEKPDDTSARELDWDRDAGLWTVSEREYGSSTWFLGMPADAWDLGQILVFFRMTEPVREENLARMSPGACAMAHASQQGPVDLVADVCPDCGEHWLVYRLETDELWRLYGRSCGYSWHRGAVVDPVSDSLLASLINTTAAG